MIPTRGLTHEDTVHHPGEIDLPCDSIFPNNHTAGILQTGPCGSNGNHCSICEKKVIKYMEQYQDCPNMRTRVIESTAESRPEISQKNICIEQEKDPSIEPILQWKRNGIKPDWSTVALYGRELIGTNGLQ